VPSKAFVLSRSKNGKFVFNLHAGNGQVVLTSEMYEDRSGAENGIASVRKNAATKARFEMREAKDGRPYFVLKAGNGQIVGRSQMYSNPRTARNGMASVMTNAEDARLIEE
jgi:uncharacterized protein YegP (UPF0339 family)